MNIIIQNGINSQNGKKRVFIILVVIIIYSCKPSEIKYWVEAITVESSKYMPKSSELTIMGIFTQKFIRLNSQRYSHSLHYSSFIS